MRVAARCLRCRPAFAEAAIPTALEIGAKPTRRCAPS